jgi:hypothetical protein
VVKKLSREAGDEAASMAMSLMQSSRVVEIDLSLAPEAATLGLQPDLRHRRHETQLVTRGDASSSACTSASTRIGLVT